MLGLIWLMFVFAVGLAFWHDTFKQALLVGGGTSVLLTLLYRAIGGSRWMRWGGRFISDAAVGARLSSMRKRRATRRPGKCRRYLRASQRSN